MLAELALAKALAHTHHFIEHVRRTSEAAFFWMRQELWGKDVSKTQSHRWQESHRTPRSNKGPEKAKQEDCPKED